MTAFVCPKCGAVSSNPHDKAHRYCGRCHLFFDEAGNVTPDKLRVMAERIAQELADQGRVIEAGWQIYRALALRGVFGRELDRFHEAYDAGAAHLFGAIMAMLEPGTDETPADLRRMDRIYAEVSVIEERMRLKFGRPAGSG